MFNKTAYGLGSVRSYIREVFEYGRQQAKIVGEENVFDYSLGNPSIPAPEKVNETIINVLNTESSIKVHGYTSGPGDDTIREAVAKNLTERFGKVIRPANLFFTCGAAPALMTALTALACEDSEVIAIAPFFPEYKPFIESSGNKFVMVPADTTSFQIDMAALESLVMNVMQSITTQMSFSYFFIMKPSLLSLCIYSKSDAEAPLCAAFCRCECVIRIRSFRECRYPCSGASPYRRESSCPE